MSQSKSKYEAERWWLTAKEDLEGAFFLSKGAKK
jgi:hypothetical protein